MSYSSLHLWTLGITWLLAAGIGVPAALMMEHQPGGARPGCKVPVDPFQNPYSQTVDDPGFNFILSFIVIGYMISTVVILVFLVLICWHRMADKRFR